MSWKATLLLLCVWAPFFKVGGAIPISTEGDNDERSFKRELELFDNEIMDDWKMDDQEYLSREEYETGQGAASRNRIDDGRGIKEDKRWLNVDAKDEPVKISPADKRELPEDGEMFQGDIVMSSFVREVFNGEASKRDAISLEQYYWPDGKVYYEFSPNIDQGSKEQIERAMDDYHRYTCIKFIQKEKGDGIKDFAYFVSNGTSCYSNVGRRGGEQIVSIGSGCQRHGTPIHEMMHVLGFFHEMARPDRDDYVTIAWENIEEDLKHNFRMIPKSMDLPTGPYNIDSVLHYSNYAFSRNGEPTITFRREPGRKFGQRQGFTVGDVREINTLYKCPEFNQAFRHFNIHHILSEENTSDSDEYYEYY